MPIVCICNNFNAEQIQGAFDRLGADLSAQPSLEEIYQFYRDVYEWCGVEYHQEEGRRPRCHACFSEFIDLAIDRFFKENCPAAKILLEQRDRLAPQEIKRLYRPV